jgi:autotransporter-associated beta strand protein
MSGTEILYGTVSLVALTQANTYTGPTTVRKGALRLAGTGGSALNTSAFNVRSTSALDVLPNAFLQLDAGLAHAGWENETGAVVGNNNNRVADTTPVNLYSGTMHFFGNPDTGTTETIGPLNAQSGLASLDARWKTGSIIYGYRSVLMDRGGSGTGAAVLTAQSLNLNNGAHLMMRGINLGVAGSSATRVMFATPPTMVGGGGGAGSTTLSILPGVWKTGYLEFVHVYTPGQNDWVTYDASVGLRALSSGEYSTLSVGENSDNNARYDLTGASPTLDISSPTTVNSLKLLNDTSSGPTTVSGAGPLTLKSGNLLVEHPYEFDGLTMSVPLDFNGNAGQVVWFPITHQINYLDSPMSNTGGKGVSLSAFQVVYVYAMEDIRIRGNNTYTGPSSINFGRWRISGSNERIPDASDLAVHSSAGLTVDSGLTETVASLSGAGTLALGNTSSRMILGSGAGVAGAVTLEGAGAYIAPGDGTNSAGTLTLSGLSATDGLRLRSGELRIDLMHAQDYDVLAVGSTMVTISDGGYAGSTLVLNLGYAAEMGDVFKIVDVSGATQIVGKFSNGDSVRARYQDKPYGWFNILYNSSLGGGDGNDVVLRCTGLNGTVIMVR